MSTEKLRIIVSGLAALHPVGGVAWDYLQYVIGLYQLGHDVYYHEDTWSWPYEPVLNSSTADPAYSVAFISRFFEDYAPELKHRWHYVHLKERSFGLSQQKWAEVVRSADVFINVSGACIIPEGLPSRCIKVFLDTDPGYNQIVLSELPSWSENVDRWRDSVLDHDRFFTYAENIGGRDCKIPTLSLDWRTTRMPVVMQFWESISDPPWDAPWTTILTWNAFKGRLRFKGVEYGSKNQEFERILSLPSRTTADLRIAVGGVEVPRERLVKAGWDVVDGPTATLTPQHYQAFIAASRGELSPAKHVYVALRTGWFSTRTACYLAAGRPVIVQDTGFRALYPVGVGLLTYSDEDEADAGLDLVESAWARHSNAAREIAQTEFAAPVVLSRFLVDIAAR